jgi:hypothetical protein
MRTQQRVQTACNEASNLIQVRLFTLSHISVLKFTIHLSLQRLMNNCYSMLPLVFNNWQTACNNSFSTLVLYTPEERMVSNIQENGLPDFCTQVSNLSKAAPNYFSHMGYCFTRGDHRAGSGGFGPKIPISPQTASIYLQPNFDRRDTRIWRVAGERFWRFFGLGYAV